MSNPKLKMEAAKGDPMNGTWSKNTRVGPILSPSKMEEQYPKQELKGVEEIASKRELWGWYFWEASSSGFSGSVLPVFLPLLLVTLATSQAWSQLGQSAPLPCNDTNTVNCVKCYPGLGDRLLTASGVQDLQKLSAYIGPIGINPVTFATLSLGISVIFQVITLATAGPLVDYGDRRKTVLSICTVIGSTACMLLFAIDRPSLWWLGGILCIVGNVAYGLGSIAYNSYLPILTDCTQEMQEAKKLPEIEQHIVRFRVENKISLSAVIFGALLSLVCIVVSFAAAFIPHISTILCLRIACLIGGLWWLVGYIPSLLWLKRRPGPPLLGKVKPWMGLIEFGSSIKESRRLKYAWRFLVIYFIYSGGSYTLTQIGILFGQQKLCMSTSELLASSLLVHLSALVGSPIFGFVQRQLHWDNNRMLMLSLSWMGILPIYGIVGYFTPNGSFGLKHSLEMYIFCLWYGVSAGAVYSYSRTLFVDLIPIGREGAMFSLWGLSSKGSAWIGPCMVAVLVQLTGDLRSTFVYALVAIWIPIVLLWWFMDNTEGLLESGRVAVHVTDNFKYDKSLDYEMEFL